MRCGNSQRVFLCIYVYIHTHILVYTDGELSLNCIIYESKNTIRRHEVDDAEMIELFSPFSLLPFLSPYTLCVCVCMLCIILLRERGKKRKKNLLDARASTCVWIYTLQPKGLTLLFCFTLRAFSLSLSQLNLHPSLFISECEKIVHTYMQERKAQWHAMLCGALYYKPARFINKQILQEVYMHMYIFSFIVTQHQRRM